MVGGRRRPEVKKLWFVIRGDRAVRDDTALSNGPHNLHDLHEVLEHVHTVWQQVITFCFSHLLGTNRLFGSGAALSGMISSLPLPVNHSTVGS